MLIVLPNLELPDQKRLLLSVRLSTLSEIHDDECLPGRLLGNLAYSEADLVWTKPQAVSINYINWVVS